MAQKIERQDLIEELQRVAAKLGEPPASTDMKEHSKYSKQPYQTEFGKWNDALRAANLEVKKTYGIEYPTNECEYCGNEYRVRPSVQQRSQYCGEECMYKHREEKMRQENLQENAGLRIPKICEQCGSIIYAIPARKDIRRFCDKDCLGKYISHNYSGKDSPHYEGGHVEYYGPNWRRKRRQRLEIDNYECQRCGIKEEQSKERWGKGLEIHHKTPFKKFESYENANKIDNLITLCVSCHAKID